MKRYLLAAIIGVLLVLALVSALFFTQGDIAPAKIKIAAGGTMEVLDTVRVPWDFRMSEFSGLAWDKDEQLLYVVSDLGHIIHFQVDIKDGKISSLIPVFFGPLTLTVGEQKFADTEDLTVLNGANGKKGDSEIAVVFEDGPAAAHFTTTGQFIDGIPLPVPLTDGNAYREVNQRLESIAVMPDHSYLLAPQTPLKGKSRKHHLIYAADGQQWRIKALKPKRTSIKALELLPDGALLVLEAINDGGLLGAIGLGGKEAHLLRIDFAACTPDGKCPQTRYAPVDGTPLRGRYEGVTNVSGDLFLMVTDQTFGADLTLVRLSDAPK